MEQDEISNIEGNVAVSQETSGDTMTQGASEKRGAGGEVHFRTPESVLLQDSTIGVRLVVVKCFFVGGNPRPLDPAGAPRGVD